MRTTLFFYYENKPQPCEYVSRDKNNGVVTARNLITGKIFIVDPELVDPRPRYNLEVVKYVKRRKKMPPRNEIAEHCGITERAVYYALRAAEGEI